MFGADPRLEPIPLQSRAIAEMMLAFVWGGAAVEGAALVQEEARRRAAAAAAASRAVVLHTLPLPLLLVLRPPPPPPFVRTGTANKQTPPSSSILHLIPFILRPEQVQLAHHAAQVAGRVAGDALRHGCVLVLVASSTAGSRQRQRHPDCFRLELARHSG